MRITLKLYATLSEYLPSGAVRNVITLTVQEDTTVEGVIAQLRLPREMVHLVLVNGVYVTPEERPTMRFSENDALAIWPPVAGG